MDPRTSMMRCMMWALVAVAMVALGFGVTTWFLTRTVRSLRQRLREGEQHSVSMAHQLQQRHTHELQNVTHLHGEAMSQAQQRYDDVLLNERSEHDSVRAALQEKVDSLLEHRRTGLKYEELSRSMIIKSCQELRLDAVLATNVVFVPEGKTFASQLDHVLVTDRAVLIIENKRWQGLVFDGVNPRQESECFEVLIKDDLEAPFAIQIVADSDETWTVRRYAKKNGRSVAPRVQVKRQAVRLREHLTARLGSCGWLGVAVLYSHKAARVFGPRRQDFVELAWDQSTLTEVIKTHAYGRPWSGPSMVAVIDELAGMSAEVYGVGKYHDRYPGLPLTRPVSRSSGRD